MRVAILLSCVATWLVAGGCGDSTASPTDTGLAGDTAADAADAATPDTQVPPTDTAQVDTREDTAALLDTAEADSAVPPADTGALDDSAPGDVGPNDTAAADATANDTAVSEDTTAPPLGLNVLGNGSFEVWADGLPVDWYGGESNLATEGVLEDTTAAHDGVRSCRLVNPSSTHKRFTTAPLALQAGHYSCRYWVRGAGEIRNARYNAGYSSYTSYTVLAADAWQPLDYAFTLAADASAFELVFSVRNTDAAGGDLRIDDVHCARADEPCDAVVCADYQRCVNAQAACVTAPGFCADDTECAAWQLCGADHRCALAPGACEATADCDGDTPVCDLTAHACVAGDPCAGVTCLDWQACWPADASCVPAPGRCASLADCDQALPTCALATHTCAPVDDPANVVPNGGFESWDLYSIGGPTEYLLPDAWYGVCDGCSPYWPTSEITPTNVKPYTTSTHSGTTALQLIDLAAPAERFVSDPFPVAAGASYQCSYWVRGHGTFRQRGYCGGWGPDTTYTAIDSDAWQQVTFAVSGAVNWCVIVLYASNTVADRDHLQFDDMVCVRP